MEKLLITEGPNLGQVADAIRKPGSLLLFQTDGGDCYLMLRGLHRNRDGSIDFTGEVEGRGFASGVYFPDGKNSPDEKGFINILP